MPNDLDVQQLQICLRFAGARLVCMADGAKIDGGSDFKESRLVAGRFSIRTDEVEQVSINPNDPSERRIVTVPGFVVEVLAGSDLTEIGRYVTLGEAISVLASEATKTEIETKAEIEKTLSELALSELAIDQEDQESTSTMLGEWSERLDDWPDDGNHDTW